MRIALALLVLTGTAFADVPADVAVYGPSGLQLGGTVLFKGQVDTAAYDRGKDLIWLLSKGQLEVIDLRDKATVTVIAKNVPETQFAIDGVSTVVVDTDYAKTWPYFHLDAKPRVEIGQGAYAGIDQDGDKAKNKLIKKIEIVGKKWIAAQQKRSANQVPAARTAPPDVKLPSGVGECEDATQCGHATWVGESAYQAVVIEHSCGDACHLSCSLYDPKTKKFAKGGAWGTTPEAMGCEYVATTDRYLAGDRVCTLADLKCTALGGDWIAFAFVAKTP